MQMALRVRWFWRFLATRCTLLNRLKDGCFAIKASGSDEG